MKYEIKIRFNTDRTLTETELDQLIATLDAQIAEPADEFGDDVEFTTNDVRIESKGDLTINRYGDCQLCGEIIESGLCIEPFGNCCDKCVKEIKAAN